jgi:hypothetical protein
MNLGRKETRERRRKRLLSRESLRIGRQPNFIAIDTSDVLDMPSGLIGILRAPFARPSMVQQPAPPQIWTNSSTYTAMTSTAVNCESLGIDEGA